jgi:type IV secretory pathway component VirB8
MIGALLERISPRSASGTPSSTAAKPKPAPSYLSEHDGSHAQKTRRSMTDRLLIALLGISMALNIVLAIAVLQLVPLYRVVPFFVTFSDKADQIVRIEPPTGNLQAIELMTQKEVESYIVKRFTISNDPQETIDRWSSHVYRRSIKKVQDDFQAETAPVLASLTDRRMTRSIDVAYVTKSDDRGLWRVEFTVTDRKLGTGLTDGGEEKRTFVAQLRVANLAQNVAHNDRFLNPMGFTVLEFSVAAKRSS